MFELFDEIITTIEDDKAVIITSAVLLLAVVIAVIVSTPHIGRWMLRARTRQPKQLQKQLIILLSNADLVEFYEPSSQYVYNLDEDEKKKKINAWMSPYSRAVKATVRRKGRTPKSQFFNARKQIKEVSKHINIRKLNDAELKTIAPKEDSPEHSQFALVLQYDGKNPEKLKTKLPSVKSQLGLQEMIEFDANNPRSMTLICSMDELDDPLVNIKPDKDFFDKNPAKSPTILPMALTSDGCVWSLPTHHTFIFGSTGSGKSGPMLAAIYQWAKFIREGSVELYGIDPKRADLIQFEYSSLFKNLGFRATDAILIIEEIYELLNDRIEKGNGSTSKTVVLMIDELFTLKKRLQDRDGKIAWTHLEEIMAMGRSENVFIYAASQFADKNNLEDLRGNFQNWIVLRQESSYLNDLFLGEHAADKGYDSTSIPLSNPANGYRYSGIGYVRGEGGKPVKLRFAYLSRSDLDELISEHKDDDVSLGVVDERTPEPEEDEDIWGFEEVEEEDDSLPDLDGFK